MVWTVQLMIPDSPNSKVFFSCSLVVFSIQSNFLIFIFKSDNFGSGSDSGSQLVMF